MYEYEPRTVLDPLISVLYSRPNLMPPRWVIVGIVAFWLVMTGWLFFRELWPRLQPGQPPPFRIDLADEAQNNIPIRWSIIKDGEDRGYARTWVNFRTE